MRRVLMYSQDGMGLGHLRRSSNIAHEILAQNPACDILILADSPAISLFPPTAGIDYLKLPTIVKTDSARWSNASLSLSAEHTIRLRSRVIVETYREFRPDTVLIDHMPVGAHGELKPLLDAATRGPRPANLFLGLRDVLDDPRVIRRTWASLGAFEQLSRYEAVLIYGSPEIYDTVAAYGLREQARRIIYCDYVSPRRVRPESPSASATTLPDEPFILMMGGGGHDAYPLARAFLQSAPIVLRKLGMQAVLLTGPNMSADKRQTLVAEHTTGVRIESGIEDAAAWIERAAAVVTMGGYNSLCEVLKWRKKALVIPRAGPSAEQRIRSRLFAERNLIRAIPPGTPSSERIARELIALISDDSVPDPAWTPLLDGAQRSASALLEISEQLDRSPARERAPIPIDTADGVTAFRAEAL